MIVDTIKYEEVNQNIGTGSVIIGSGIPNPQNIDISAATEYQKMYASFGIRDTLSPSDQVLFDDLVQKEEHAQIMELLTKNAPYVMFTEDAIITGTNIYRECTINPGVNVIMEYQGDYGYCVIVANNFINNGKLYRRRSTTPPI